MAAFRPEIWTDAFAQFFAAQPSLLDNVTSYDEFVGTAQRGDTIVIPDLTLAPAGDIVPGAVAVGAKPGDAAQKLVINKFKGHAIPFDALDERFNHPAYRDRLMSEAARQIRNATNRDVLSLAVDPAVLQEVNPDASALTDADLLEAGKLLTNAEMPQEGRILVVPPQGYADLAGITTFISGDFGPGQTQNSVSMCRGFRVIQMPEAYFSKVGANLAAIAYHPMAIGRGVAAPHFDMVKQAGQFQSVIEIGTPYGLKITKAAGIVRILRAP